MGGKSKYVEKREARTSVSRYRKTRAVLTEILLLRLTAENLPDLGTMRQGRNSNDKSRNEKYRLDLEEIESFFVDRIVYERPETPVTDAEIS